MGSNTASGVFVALTGALATLNAFVLLGCAEKIRARAPAPEPTLAAAPAPAPEQEPTTPEPTPTPAPPAESPGIVLAEGWKDVVITANYAKTTVDVTGHFYTSRNACGMEALGVLTPEAWTTFAVAINETSAAELIAQGEPTCLETSDTRPSMDGSVEIKFQDGTRKTYLEHASWLKVCSNLKNPDLARRLLAVINSVVVAADKEECPNGWGS